MKKYHKRLVAFIVLLALSLTVAVPAFAEDDINILLDGQLMYPRVFKNETEVTAAQTVNHRTMIPIRFLAESIGGTVEWNNDTQEVTITRAGTVIVMTIDSTTAIVNDEPVEMDVAPYLANGRTYLPVRFVSEFLGQTVSWDESTRTVSIYEDKSVVGKSNLEAWALPMGAMLVSLNREDISVFGGNPRFYTTSSGYSMIPSGARSILNNQSWDVTSREDLIETIVGMTFDGHNGSFAEFVELLDYYRAMDMYEEFLDSVSDTDRAMFEFTQEIYDKWGDRGIICWDLFRMSNLAQWGYAAGYVTYAEALALIEPAATLLAENFTSWDEAYENYLYGYQWWSRASVDDIWSTSRAGTYNKMKSQDLVFDNSLFETGVIGLDE